MLINLRSLHPQLRVALLSWSVSPRVIFLFGNLFLGGKTEVHIIIRYLGL